LHGPPFGWNLPMRGRSVCSFFTGNNTLRAIAD
jgi:hypothetical protein